MKKIIVLVVCGIGIGVVCSLLAAEMVERTAGVRFCASCHTMKGPARAYAEDVHGGNNPYGVRARCVDCHLPHDNVAHYLAAKAMTGTKDVLGEMFWARKVDWKTNLKNRKEFVYTSGCLQCHDLGTMRYEIPKAFLAHREFQMGVVDSCVKCHEHVGHRHIGEHLPTIREAASIH